MSETGETGETGETAGISKTLEDQIRTLVSEQLGVDRAEMTPSAKILEDLGADSLDLVELVMALEEAFDIEISDEDAELMSTVGEVESYVARELRTKRSLVR